MRPDRRNIEIAEPKYLDMGKVYLEALTELAKPFPSVRLTQWPNFSHMTGGFRPREFSILCGATGSGKTTLLANISAQLVLQDVSHFVMSVETGHTDYMKRIISVLTKADINTGDPVPISELERIQLRYGDVLCKETVQFALYEDRLPVEQLMHDIKHMVDTHGCKIAMIDNLNFFMEVKSASESIVEMDRVIHSLIIFCKQVDVHIIMVMHPRKTEGDGRITSEFEIKGSSTSVQEAHNVFLFNRPRQEDIDSGVRNWFSREITLQKMRRRGSCVGKTIIFDSEGTRYIEKGFV